MEEGEGHYSPVRHENAAIIEGLRELYNKYNEKQKYKLMDYLVEWWTTDYPKREKDLVDEIRLMQERDGPRAGNNTANPKWSVYSSFEHIVRESGNKPETFMKKLLGEEEWNSLHRRLIKRHPLEILKIHNSIKYAIAEANATSDKGRHYFDYLDKDSKED